MKGSTFRVNEDFYYNRKGSSNEILGRSIMRENTIVTILDEDVRRGKKCFCLSNGIGWITNNSPIWNKLDIKPTIVQNADKIDEDKTQYEYQHQEGPNEDYFECEAEYLEGDWCR